MVEVRLVDMVTPPVLPVEPPLEPVALVLAESDADSMRYEIMPSILRARSWQGEVQLRHQKSSAPIAVEATLFLDRDSCPDQG